MCDNLYPSLPDVVCKYFEEKLKTAKSYLEFGSGGSTVLASKFVKGDIISVESDIEWFNKLQTNFKDNSKVKLHLVDLMCKPHTWGHPSVECPESRKREYSQIVKTLDLSDVNLILIDGRFRVACALHIHSLITNETDVLFDDFEDRLEHYSIVLNYYDVVARIDRMIHLRKKDVVIPTKIIEKYELIAI
jgi:hypothetical protein